MLHTLDGQTSGHQCVRRFYSPQDARTAREIHGRCTSRGSRVPIGSHPINILVTHSRTSSDALFASRRSHLTAPVTLGAYVSLYFLATSYNFSCAIRIDKRVWNYRGRSAQTVSHGDSQIQNDSHSRCAPTILDSIILAVGSTDSCTSRHDTSACNRSSASHNTFINTVCYSRNINLSTNGTSDSAGYWLPIDCVEWHHLVANRIINSSAC
jgi:hypothetical protein